MKKNQSFLANIDIQMRLFIENNLKMKDCIFIEIQRFKIHSFWYTFTFSFIDYFLFLDTKIHLLISSDCAIGYS